MNKKILSIILVLAILCTLPFTGIVSANEQEEDFPYHLFSYFQNIIPDEKTFSSMTIEYIIDADIEDDIVMIVLNQARSWEQSEFTIEDFPEVELAEVMDLDRITLA